MSESRLTTKNEAATGVLAASLAGLATPGDVLLLSGPLGAGKTAFARAFIRTLAGDQKLEIPSPSFTLLQSYETPTATIHHYDFWRLAGPEALAELAWDEAQSGIILAEWPDRLGPFTPPHALHIIISLSPAGREIMLRSGAKKWFHAS